MEEKTVDGFVKRTIEVRKGKRGWFQGRVIGKDGKMKYFIFKEVKELVKVS
jgi:hypothetical protein